MVEGRITGMDLGFYKVLLIKSTFCKNTASNVRKFGIIVLVCPQFSTYSQALPPQNAHELRLVLSPQALCSEHCTGIAVSTSFHAADLDFLRTMHAYRKCVSYSYSVHACLIVTVHRSNSVRGPTSARGMK